MKILCPIDLSETSRHAFRQAVHVAKLEGGSITLLRVHQPNAVTSIEDLGEDLQPVLERGDRAAFKEWVEEETGEEKALGGVEIDERFIIADPASGIVELAEEEGYDLIVIGNKGRTAVNRFLLGSVTSKVMHHASCNVLLVR